MSGGVFETVKEWVEFFHLIVPSALVIVGWRFVSNDNNKRERRKEVRSQVDGLCADIFEVEAKARQYFVLAGAVPDAKTLGMTIRRDLRNISMRLQRLQLSNVAVTADNKFMLLRQEITGSEFDTKARTALAPDSPKLNSIAEAACNLVHEIETDFFAKFPGERTKSS